jgi:outer membrane lipoprotein SlyB
VIASIRATEVRQSWAPLGSATPDAPGDLGSNAGRTGTSYSIGKDGKSKGMVLLGPAGGTPYAARPKDVRKQQRWDITVRMDSGASRVVQQSYEPSLREGDRVRVFGTQLELEQP